jgi:hypothetical protein
MPADAAEGSSRVRRRRAKAPKASAAPAPASIVLRDPRSGEGRRIKIGFAWDLFLFASVFGVPLFLRRLHGWGAAVLALWVLDLALGWHAGGTPGTLAQLLLFGAFLALQLWLGAKGNALTARTLLAQGWTLDRPEDAAARRIVERWKSAER